MFVLLLGVAISRYLKSVVLVRVSDAVKRYHDYRNSVKGQYLIEAGVQFRGLVHYHHGGRHGSVQAGMALETELRVPQAAEGDRVPHWTWLEHRRPQSPPPQ